MAADAIDESRLSGHGRGIKCPRCRAENSADAVFCDERGLRLEFTCPGCGQANRIGAKFCKKCGQPLNRTDAPDPAITARFASPDSDTPMHIARKILTSKSALEGTTAACGKTTS